MLTKVLNLNILSFYDKSKYQPLINGILSGKSDYFIILMADIYLSVWQRVATCNLTKPDISYTTKEKK